VIHEEFSQCNNDVNIWLWTDGSMFTKDEVQTKLVMHVKESHASLTVSFSPSWQSFVL